MHIDAWWRLAYSMKSWKFVLGYFLNFSVRFRLVHTKMLEYCCRGDFLMEFGILDPSVVLHALIVGSKCLLYWKQLCGVYSLDLTYDLHLLSTGLKVSSTILRFFNVKTKNHTVFSFLKTLN